MMIKCSVSDYNYSYTDFVISPKGTGILYLEPCNKMALLTESKLLKFWIRNSHNDESRRQCGNEATRFSLN